MPYFVGLMSGTSMDAVDGVIVEFPGTTVRLLAHTSQQWPRELQRRVRLVAAGESTNAETLATLDRQMGEFFAQTCLSLLGTSGIGPAEIEAIGCHGQTVAHESVADPPTTLQIGDANLIAERTGIATVNDFRRRDIAAGGQGAPLAPAFHAAYLRVPSEDRVVLNLGGIANITLLPADPGLPIVGFDTGPANCLMDAWIQRIRRQPFDADGVWAASSATDEDLLRRLLEDPYFSRPSPKSTGTRYFDLAWLQTYMGHHTGLDDATVQATLLSLTAESVAMAVGRYAENAARILVCGGGARNGALVERLADASGLPVESTSAYGIDAAWMEAMAFAWLAQQTLRGLPGNVPTVTGATGARVLGAIHPA